MKHYINGTNNGVVGIDAKGRAKGQAKGLRELAIEEFNLWKTGEYSIIDGLLVKNKQIRTVDQIDLELKALDERMVRPNSSINASVVTGDDVAEDIKILAELVNQSKLLRAERSLILEGDK